MYAWKCMSMWRAKIIASWAQPNPNLPAHKQFNIYNTHLNAWKYSYNAHGMQCIKILKHFHKNQPKNFTITSSILKNPKKFSKTQKPRSNAWRMKDLDTYQVMRNLIKAKNQLRMKFGVREGSLGGEETRTDRERSSEMNILKTKRAYNLTISFLKYKIQLKFNK